MNNASSKNAPSTAPVASDSVVLFPLCDARGDLSRVLQDGKQEPGTRADALIFAWLLDLPPTVPAQAAARAVLAVSYAGARRRLTGRQKSLLRELRAIATEGDPYRNAKGGTQAGWGSVLPRWSIDESEQEPGLNGIRRLEKSESQ